MNVIYTIRSVRTGRTVNCYEGEESRGRVHSLVEGHNAGYPEDQWTVSVEVA